MQNSSKCVWYAGLSKFVFKYLGIIRYHFSVVNFWYSKIIKSCFMTIIKSYELFQTRSKILQMIEIKIKPILCSSNSSQFWSTFERPEPLLLSPQMLSDLLSLWHCFLVLIAELWLTLDICMLDRLPITDIYLFIKVVIVEAYYGSISVLIYVETVVIISWLWLKPNNFIVSSN